jgi:O-antigen ligase
MFFNSPSEKLLFYTTPTILFSLLPFFLITGPFLSDLSISIIAILFLLYCYKKKKFSYFNNQLFYFFLIFWSYLVFNSLINNTNLDSLKISIFYVRYGVFVISIITLLNFDQKFLRYFFYCTFICFVILILDGFYQYFVGENILGYERSYRTSSFFGEEKILGSYLSRLWPIFFGLSIFIIKNKKSIFYLLIIIFVLSEVLIFISGDRTAFFYINLSAIFIILLSQKLFKLRLITLLSSVILITIIAFINPTAKERVFDQTFKQMNLDSLVEKKKDNEKQIKNNTINIFTIEHTHHYMSAYKMFLDNKIIGVGVKNFRNFCNNDKYKISNFSCSSHPHNTYMQILVETGIIGFSFLCFILLYFCFYVLKHFMLKLKKEYYFKDFEICILSGIAIYLWPIVPTGNIFNNWLNILMFLNIPLLVWSLKLKRNQSI